MDCPRCKVTLSVEKHKGIQVDRCPGCEGMWLDYDELDHLEDTVMENDQQKGTMMFKSFGSELSCPRCKAPMKWFRYRQYDLEMDFCEAEHGFWLDKGEEKRVREIMEQRTRNLRRSASAEVDWDRFLSSFGSKSFMDNIKRMFRR